MISWEKQGRVFSLPNNHAFGKTHIQLPVLNRLENGGFELFFSTRDEHNITHGARLRFDSLSQLHKARFDDVPVLKPGRLGTFDDMGSMPSSVVNYKGDTYLYYIGWNVRNTVPYHNSIGLAIRKKGQKAFEKISEGPIIDRTYKEPYFAGTNSVILDKGLWRMWYLSCTDWQMVNGKPEARYLLRYASSNNGIDWIRDGRICIDYESDHEAIAGASVVKFRNKYIMMYCLRDIDGYRTDSKKSYRLKFAESRDGLGWTKQKKSVWAKDEFESWESEMQAYPFLFVENDELYMLYNGNGFGQTGVGLAKASFVER